MATRFWLCVFPLTFCALVVAATTTTDNDGCHCTRSVRVSENGVRFFACVPYSEQEEEEEEEDAPTGDCQCEWRADRCGSESCTLSCETVRQERDPETRAQSVRRQFSTLLFVISAFLTNVAGSLFLAIEGTKWVKKEKQTREKQQCQARFAKARSSAVNSPPTPSKEDPGNSKDSLDNAKYPKKIEPPEECCVCMHASPSVWFKECGHQCVCDTCMFLLREPECPVCRKKLKYKNIEPAPT
jgi:hypothetical protein